VFSVFGCGKHLLNLDKKSCKKIFKKENFILKINICMVINISLAAPRQARQIQVQAQRIQVQALRPLLQQGKNMHFWKYQNLDLKNRNSNF
jgi:hypothetical protein